MITNVMGTDILVSEIQAIGAISTPNCGFTYGFTVCMKQGRDIYISVSDTRQYDLRKARVDLYEAWTKLNTPS